ncbi:MAG: transposase [Chloroflexota bacterium]
MIDIITQLQCLSPKMDHTTLRQMSRIIETMLAMTGRVTMLGISRWGEKGSSYRTVQRYFHTLIPWAELFWLFFRSHLYQTQAQYILAGDESVITKAGKETHGLDRFFSSLYGKSVSGLAFFALSLIDVAQRQSYPICVEQVVRIAEEKAQAKKKARQKTAKKRGKPGRPKGCKNRDKAKVILSPELIRIQQMLNKLMHLMSAYRTLYLFE